jgi:hypothetical protein
MGKDKQLAMGGIVPNQDVRTLKQMQANHDCFMPRSTWDKFFNKGTDYEALKRNIEFKIEGNTLTVINKQEYSKNV